MNLFLNKPLSVRAKSFLANGFILTIACAVAVMIYIYQGSLVSETTHIFNEKQEMQTKLRQLERSFNDSLAILFQFLATNQPSLKSDAETLIGTISQQETEINAYINPDSRGIFRELHKSLDSWKTISLETLRKFSGNAKTIDAKQILVLSNTVDTNFHALEYLLDDAMDGRIDKFFAQIQRAPRLYAGAITIGALIGVFGSWLMIRSVLIRIYRVVQSLEKIGSEHGSLSDRLPVLGDDELARLSSSYNQFVEKIERVVSLVLNSSDGLAKETIQISKRSLNIETSAEIQKQDISQIVCDMQTLNEVTQEINNKAESTQDDSQKSLQESQKGQVLMENTIASINELAEQVNESTNVVGDIQRETETISEVLNMIRDITDQTNLIALNAAIEAARAGDAGKGFSVVADEVRGLAARTDRETKNISVLLENLQGRVNQATKTMDVGREKANVVVDQAHQTLAAFDSILEATNHITALSQEIVESTHSQFSFAEKINIAMANVNGVAEETLNHSKLAKEGNNELCMMAEQLSKLVLQILEGTESTDINPESNCNKMLAYESVNSDTSVTLF